MSAIALISKLPSPQVAERLLQTASATGKPTVVNFIGYTPNQSAIFGDTIQFAASLEERARLTVELIKSRSMGKAAFHEESVKQ